MEENPRGSRRFSSPSPSSLSAAPQAALAQVVVRAVPAPAAMSGAAAASVTGASAVAPLTALTPSLSLTGVPSFGAAPSVITAAPALTPAAALPAAARPIQGKAPPRRLACRPAAASLPSNEVSRPRSRLDPDSRRRRHRHRRRGRVGPTCRAMKAPLSPPPPSPPPARPGRPRLADVVRGRAEPLLLVRRVAFPAARSPRRSSGAWASAERQAGPAAQRAAAPTSSRRRPRPTASRPSFSRPTRFPAPATWAAILETSRKVLNADANDVAAVVNAIKGMVDADRTRYGVASSELRLIGARKFEGRGEQADSIFVHFRQVKGQPGRQRREPLLHAEGHRRQADGGRAQTGQVFLQIDVNTESTLTEEEEQIMGKIAERVGMPVADVTGQFQFSEEKIIYSRGSWRHVKLYVAEGFCPS